MDSVARPVGCVWNEKNYVRRDNVRTENDMRRIVVLFYERDLLMDLLLFDHHILDHSSGRPQGIAVLVVVAAAMCHSIRRPLHTGGARHFCNNDCCCSVSCKILRHRNDLLLLSNQWIVGIFSANSFELGIESERQQGEADELRYKTIIIIVRPVI